MDEKEIFLFGINPVLEALKVSPNDICEILIGKGSSAPTLRGVEGGPIGNQYLGDHQTIAKS